MYYMLCAMYNVCNPLSVLGSHAGTQLEDNENKSGKVTKATNVARMMGMTKPTEVDSDGDEPLVRPGCDLVYRVRRRRRNLDLLFKAFEIGFRLAVPSCDQLTRVHLDHASHRLDVRGRVLK